MNELNLVGKVEKVYPAKESKNGYKNITFTIKTAKIYNMEQYFEHDNIAYATIPVMAWKKIADRVEKDLKPGDLIFARCHVAVFESKSQKGATYLNPKIILDGYTPNYESKMSAYGKTDEEIRHECLALLEM